MPYRYTASLAHFNFTQDAVYEVRKRQGLSVSWSSPYPCTPAGLLLVLCRGRKVVFGGADSTHIIFKNLYVNGVS